MPQNPYQKTLLENDRAMVLDTAKELITGDRQNQYGSFRDQMVSIAGAFNSIRNDQPVPLEPEDVALILMLLKVKRSTTSKDVDSYVDICGYAALTAEHFLKGGK